MPRAGAPSFWSAAVDRACRGLKIARMITPTEPAAAASSPIALSEPVRVATPFVFASPHSGRAYDPVLTNQTRVRLELLRRSEDAYIDRLFETAPSRGAPLLAALFPRVFIDPNRGPDELDPDMFDPPARHGGPVSARAAGGLGVVPRLAADGRPLYSHPLPFAEARRRLDGYYRPYHAALDRLITERLRRFGEAIVIDCHSMPSASARGADIVLGDRYGASCSRALVSRAEAHFRELGFAVVRNRPYAGGYTTEFYGRPARGVHALQIEINRQLYLDELAVEPTAAMPALARALDLWMSRVIDDIVGASIAAE